MDGKDERVWRVDMRALRFWSFVFMAFWVLSTISNLSGPFDGIGVIPSLLFGFGEAAVLLAVSVWVARRRVSRR